MRAAACLPTLLLAGCSAILGVEDPVPRADDAGVDTRTDDGAVDARPDADVDAGPSVGDKLVFNVASISLAQHQTARLHVQRIHDGTMVDVTSLVSLASGNLAIATIGGPGEINGATQAGLTTITASLGDATPAKLDVTVKTTECHIVINEFATAGANPADEWVELYNPCTTMFNVDGWTLDYRAASAGALANDTNLMISLTGQMLPHALRFYTGVGYTGTDTPDGQWDTFASGIMKVDIGAVGLRNGPQDVGDIVDAVAYGDITAADFPFLESHATAAMAAGKSASRLPFDGKDDDDGSVDFTVSSTGRTPHALNAP